MPKSWPGTAEDLARNAGAGTEEGELSKGKVIQAPGEILCWWGPAVKDWDGQHWPQASQGNINLDSPFSAHPTLLPAVLWRKLWGTEAGSWRSGQRTDNAIPQSLYCIDMLWGARRKIAQCFSTLFGHEVHFSPLNTSLTGFLWNVLWEMLLTYCFLLQISRV